VTIFTGETLRLPLRLTLIPAPPPPPTNSQLTHMQALRKRLEQLPQGKIYLDAPTEMKVSDRRSVDARVGVNVPDDILKGHIRGGDQTVQATVRVSHEMIATLNGPGFKITRTTPEKQTVAESFPTVWQWEIEAKQDGVQELEATLYALVPNPDDASGAAQQRIDSYTQKISVSVKEQTWSEWLKSAHEGFDTVKAIVIAIGSVASVTLGWFGISLTRRSRRTPTTKRKPASRGRPQTAP